MKKYRKKPIVIEAIQFNCNHEEIDKWSNGKVKSAKPWKKDYINLEIDTLEGEMYVDPFDYVIKGIKGEFYSRKPDIFELTYEEIES